MEDSLRLETYTIADLRKWLMEDSSYKSELSRIIEPRRAFSIIHNPFAKDDSVVLAAIIVGDEVAAYDQGFPDEVYIDGEKKSIFWNSGLYVNPNYEGKGYGAIVIGALLELNEDNLFDHAAVPASVANFRFLGLSVDYVTMFIFHTKSYSKSFKGRLSYAMDCRLRMNICRNRRTVFSEKSQEQYSLEYVSWVDDNTFAFIKEHSADHILRTQASFNWILTYPFGGENPLPGRLTRHTVYQDNQARYGYIGVKVVSEGRTAGFYILNIKNNELVIKYLFYSRNDSALVFKSILEHILASNVEKVSTYNPELRDYIKSLKIFEKTDTYPMSFTHPANHSLPENFTLQAGEGDMFS